MRERGVRPPMGPIPSPRGNAAMESPMGIVRPECAHAQVCDTRDGAALGLFDCIEAVCDRAGTHTALGDLSPAEFEEANWPEGGCRKAA